MPTETPESTPDFDEDTYEDEFALHDVPERINTLLGNTWVRIALVVALIGGIVGLLLALDLDGDVSHLDVAVLSGSPAGFYAAQTDALAELAAEEGGKIENIHTAGSVENVERLAAASGASCEAHFALVQDGTPWPEDAELKLLGRLPRSESLFFLGKNAGEISRFAQLDGARIGIGPEGSGTALVARTIFEHASFADLNVELVHADLEEQLTQARQGTLDLAAFVIDEDAGFVREAVVEHGLEIAAFEHQGAIAHTLPFAWSGRIRAGQYDPVDVIPPSDRYVLRIDTLVIANACPSRSQRVAMLRLLAEAYPGYVDHNAERPNYSGLPTDDAAAKFYEEGGAGFVDAYFPWVVDIMPLGNWIYLAMGISVLFNLMGGWNRFRLWRIDANRVKYEHRLHELFGPTTTLEEIDEMEPPSRYRGSTFRAHLDELIDDLTKLLHRCRKQSVSLLVPMGAELTYRYQQHTIEDTIDTLRGFRQRLTEQRSVDSTSEPPDAAAPAHGGASEHEEPADETSVSSSDADSREDAASSDSDDSSNGDSRPNGDDGDDGDDDAREADDPPQNAR